METLGLIDTGPDGAEGRMHLLSGLAPYEGQPGLSQPEHGVVSRDDTGSEQLRMCCTLAYPCFELISLHSFIY